MLTVHTMLCATPSQRCASAKTVKATTRPACRMCPPTTSARTSAKVGGVNKIYASMGMEEEISAED